MKPQLRYWRDLTKSERTEIKQLHNIKVVTFDFICKVYENK